MGAAYDKNGKPIPITKWKGSWAESMKKDSNKKEGT
jgi:hypothetical protein